jgi:hypothetical protein
MLKLKSCFIDPKTPNLSSSCIQIRAPAGSETREVAVLILVARIVDPIWKPGIQHHSPQSVDVCDLYWVPKIGMVILHSLSSKTEKIMGLQGICLSLESA